MCLAGLRPADGRNHLIFQALRVGPCLAYALAGTDPELNLPEAGLLSTELSTGFLHDIKLKQNMRLPPILRKMVEMR